MASSVAQRLFLVSLLLLGVDFSLGKKDPSPPGLECYNCRDRKVGGTWMATDIGNAADNSGGSIVGYYGWKDDAFPFEGRVRCRNYIYDWETIISLHSDSGVLCKSCSRWEVSYTKKDGALVEWWYHGCTDAVKAPGCVDASKETEPLVNSDEEKKAHGGGVAPFTNVKAKACYCSGDKCNDDSYRVTKKNSGAKLDARVGWIIIGVGVAVAILGLH